MKNGIISLGIIALWSASFAGTVQTVVAPPASVDARIGLYKEVVGSATLRLSTRWAGGEMGILTVNGAEAARLGTAEEGDHNLESLAPGEYVCAWASGAVTNLATLCVRGGADVLPPSAAGVKTGTAVPVSVDARIGLYREVVGSATLRLSTRWAGGESGVLTVNGAEVRTLGAAEETDHVLENLAPGEYVCAWASGAVTNLATLCVRGGADVLPLGVAGVKTGTALPVSVDARIGLYREVSGSATLRLSTRWADGESGVLTVNGAEVRTLGDGAETDHALENLAPGEYVCAWASGAVTNLATLCVRGGADVLPPDAAGVKTVAAAPVTVDARIGLYREVVGSATLRLSTRWAGGESGILTVNGAEVVRLGTAEEADRVLENLAPGEYVCAWALGAVTNLATLCVRGGADVLPPGAAGVKTVAAVPVSVDARIGLYKEVVGSAMLRLSTRWAGGESGILTVNGAEVVRLGTAEEADRVLENLAPGEYVCVWASGAVTNLATLCVRGGADVLPPGAAGVKTGTAIPVVVDARIGLYKVLPVSASGRASVICRLSTRWDAAATGTLTANGEEIRTLGDGAEADHALENLAPGEYVCAWTADDAHYLVTFSVPFDGSVQPPRTGVEVTITGRTATYAYDGDEKRIGGFDISISDPLYTVKDFTFSGNSNAVRTVVGTTAFGMTAADFRNVNPNFSDVVFHVTDGALTITPRGVVNPFDPDDPSAPVSEEILSGVNCVTNYDGEGHSINVVSRLNPSLAADAPSLAYSLDPAHEPFTTTNPVFTNVVSTSVWYRISSANFASFTTNALLVIAPRPVTLTSGTKLDFVYDGNPHTYAQLSAEGFVTGEGVGASNWASVTAVAEGEVANTFDYVAQDGTYLANYAVTVVTGRIAVVRATVGPGGGSSGEEPGSGEVPTCGVSKFDSDSVYDGRGHTVDTNALVEAFGAAMRGEPFAVSYAVESEGDWTSNAPAFTNAGVYSVQYRVTSANYEEFVHRAQVTIAPRPITLAAPTRSKPYDGTPLTFNVIDIAVGGDGYASGECFDYIDFARITDVGVVPATFSYRDSQTAKVANYAVTVVAGRTLAVTKFPTEIVVTAKSGAWVYDGLPHTLHDCEVTNLDAFRTGDGLEVVYDVASAVTTPVDGPNGDGVVSNVISSVRILRNNRDDVTRNYTLTVKPGALTVTKRPVTLTSKSDTKVYDGTPLTAHEVTVGGMGFVGSDGAAYAFTGSQTEKGMSTNTFTYRLTDGTDAACYEIAAVAGNLTVTAADISAGEEDDWEVVLGPALVYTGLEQVQTLASVTYRGLPVDYVASEDSGTAAGAYRMTLTGRGNFAGTREVAWTIAPRPVTVQATGRMGTHTYDGTEKSVSGFDLATEDSLYNLSSTAFGGTAMVSRTDVGRTAMGLSAADFTNGDGNFDVTYAVTDGWVLVKPLDISGADDFALALGAFQKYSGAEQAVAVLSATCCGLPVTYTLTGASATHAGDYTLTLTGTGNFSGTRSAVWRILPRTVTLTSGSASKVYDGTPLAVKTVAVGGDGFVAGEGAIFDVTGAQTVAGTSKNAFTYALNAKTLAGDYEIEAVEGDLTVTKATYPGLEPGGAGIAWSVAADAATWVYDGRMHGVTLTGVPAGVTARLSGNAATDAGDYVATATLDYDAANYEPPAAPAPLAWSITPRPVTLMAASKEKPYDGFPLAVRPGDITASGRGYAPGECFDYFGFASLTDVGEIPATFGYRDSATAKVANYAVTVVGGQTLKVTVGGDQISVTAGSGTWAYDGAEHRAETWSVHNDDKLLEGHALQVTIDSTSVVRTPKDGPDGDGVVSNRFASVRIVETATGADRTRNYNLVLCEGVLQVTNACIRAEQLMGTADVEKIYDGAATQAVVTAALLRPAAVRYAAGAALPADGWAAEPPSFVHAGTQTVWYAVSADCYEPYTNSLQVAVAPRPVTLVSAGAEKVYDGTPLRADAVRVKEGSPGFVGDEGFAASCRGALTDVGAMENLFDYALTGGALAGNYAISKEYGWLRVTPATLDPGAVFGGGETDAEGRLVCARVYNGAPQPFAPAVDFGEPYRVLYALVAGDEGAYAEAAPTRTHVAEGDLVVHFKFMSPNYAPYYGTGVLRIAPKALTEEMVVADEDAAWFFDGTEKKPSVTVVDGSPNIAAADDWTVAYSDRTGAGLFPVTVTGRNDYCGTVTKEFAILKRPVAPPVIPSRTYSGRLQRPSVPEDARWTVVANPGGTDAGDYTNVVLRLASPADYRWKGLGEGETDWTGVFTVRRGANGWSVYPLIRSWTNGVDAAGAPAGRPRFGTLSVAYRRRGAPVAEETPERPSAPGRYTARFWAEETANYAGVALVTPYEVDFEIYPGPDDPPAGAATATTPVPVPHAWLDAYVARFGAGDYEAAANAVGANGVALWESYVAGLDPADAASRFTAAIAVDADGVAHVTWSPDLSSAESPRTYTVYGKAGLGDAEWTPVTDANRARMRFFRVHVELK